MCAAITSRRTSHMYIGYLHYVLCAKIRRWCSKLSTGFEVVSCGKWKRVEKKREKTQNGCKFQVLAFTTKTKCSYEKFIRFTYEPQPSKNSFFFHSVSCIKYIYFKQRSQTKNGDITSHSNVLTSANEISAQP